MKEKSPKKLIHRENAPIFPMGFRCGISNDICVIDFIDTPDENVIKVSYSVALSKKHAQNLIDNLNQFLNQDESE